MRTMKAFGCTLLAVLLLIAGYTFAADAPIIAPGAKLEKLAEGYSFTEGPAADGDGNVFFTDDPNNRIVEWHAADGKFSDWLKPAGRANGTYFDKVGNLIVVAPEKGELWSIAPDRTVTVLVTNFEGQSFNGPNDLWVRPDGGIYFTDPDFYSPRDQSTRVDGQHVYFVTPDRKTVSRVTTDLKKPNGIIGTPDGKMLYVADYGASKTFVYDIRPDGGLTNKRLFCNLGSDGMTIDAEGNVYLTMIGVTVFDRTGKRVEHIDVPIEDTTTNVTFGGKDNDLLFITATGSVYGLKMRVKGAR
ncbi:SMP-30/gluconolactonase/LRE family protein [Mesorhizobium sp. MSK_1335]|uniref:SMP-30/gluconolactonase/LRE family protein n=1 Tax=Mesorhizobium montanum TaxID=3072323 RepID=A0ABU4ZIM5_9HYPH|nr:SMP-30/gluconolactonase/LRE family protein [Mesorhizobium sp. MSK_1335]MDX8523856.1 SMP-30/gluconolactonase/LRE family protein [Mesorhizobium sp. MSK_1335]